MPIVDAVACHKCQKLVSVERARRIGTRFCCIECSRDDAPPIEDDEVRLHFNRAVAPWWVEAIGIVQFDLLLGQSLDYLCPPIPFSVSQETELSFLSFPDANSVGDGEFVHDFVFEYDTAELLPTQEMNVRRHRDAPPPPPSSSSPDASSTLSKKGNGSNGPTSMKGTHSRTLSAGLTYKEQLQCTALFQQKRDPTLARGAQQRAIVVLSKYRFPRLAHQIVRVVNDQLFGEGAPPLNEETTESALRQALVDIQSWSPPMPTRTYDDLRLLGVSLPDYRTSRYGNHDLLPGGRENGMSKIESGRMTMYSVLEAIEARSYDPSVAQSRLCRLMEYSRERTPFKSFLTDVMQLDMCDMSVWLREELLAVDRALRLGTFPNSKESCLAALAASPTRPTPRLSSLTPEVAQVVEHFSHSHYVDADVVAIQNEHLAKIRLKASLILNEAKNDSCVIDTSVEIGALMEVDLASALYPHINKLWKLWELMIIGESICVLGAEVPRVTAVCMTLASLIAPIPFVGVLRPYITVHNREVDALTSKYEYNGQRVPVIIGSTNPFFVRHWAAWPHFICITNSSSGSKDEEVENHKMLSSDSSKRPRQQFQLKNRMFSSRHYLIKTEKNLAETMRIAPPPKNKESYVLDDRYLDDLDGSTTLNAMKSAGDVSPPSTSQSTSWSSSPRSFASRVGIGPMSPVSGPLLSAPESNHAIRRVFRDLTKQFLDPVEKVIDRFFNTGSCFFSNSRDVLPTSAEVLSSLQKSELPSGIFKQRQDMMNTYSEFLNTAAYMQWLRRRQWMTVRQVILSAASLEDIILMEPDPLERYTTLNSIQELFEWVLSQPLLDVRLAEKLMSLTDSIPEVRLAVQTDDEGYTTKPHVKAAEDGTSKKMATKNGKDGTKCAAVVSQ